MAIYANSRAINTVYANGTALINVYANGYLVYHLNTWHTLYDGADEWKNVKTTDTTFTWPVTLVLNNASNTKINADTRHKDTYGSMSGQFSNNLISANNSYSNKTFYIKWSGTSQWIGSTDATSWTRQIRIRKIQQYY